MIDFAKFGGCSHTPEKKYFFVFLTLIYIVARNAKSIPQDDITFPGKYFLVPAGLLRKRHFHILQVFSVCFAENSFGPDIEKSVARLSPVDTHSVTAFRY